MARFPTIVVRVTQGVRVVQTLTFNQDTVTVGREPGMDIFLPSFEVSRAHCRLELHQARFHVVDLASKNGTKLNGLPVARHEIESGDNIQVGDFRLWIQFVPRTQVLEEKAAAYCEIPTIENQGTLRDPSPN